MKWIGLDLKISVTWPQIFYFYLGQEEISGFVNQDSMHILVFPRFQLHWLDFMYLYQAGIWQEGGMNTMTVAKLEEKDEWDRWLI